MNGWMCNWPIVWHLMLMAFCLLSILAHLAIVSPTNRFFQHHECRSRRRSSAKSKQNQEQETRWGSTTTQHAPRIWLGVRVLTSFDPYTIVVNVVPTSSTHNFHTPTLLTPHCHLWKPDPSISSHIIFFLIG